MAGGYCGSVLLQRLAVRLSNASVRRGTDTDQHRRNGTVRDAYSGQSVHRLRGSLATDRVVAVRVCGTGVVPKRTAVHGDVRAKRRTAVCGRRGTELPGDLPVLVPIPEHVSGQHGGGQSDQSEFVYLAAAGAVGADGSAV